MIDIHIYIFYTYTYGFSNRLPKGCLKLICVEKGLQGSEHLNVFADKSPYFLTSPQRWVYGIRSKYNIVATSLVLVLAVVTSSLLY